MKVKNLISELLEFPMDIEIIDNINIAWASCCEGGTKKDALFITLVDDKNYDKVIEDE